MCFQQLEDIFITCKSYCGMFQQSQIPYHWSDGCEVFNRADGQSKYRLFESIMVVLKNIPVWSWRKDEIHKAVYSKIWCSDNILPMRLPASMMMSLKGHVASTYVLPSLRMAWVCKFFFYQFCLLRSPSLSRLWVNFGFIPTVHLNGFGSQY